MQHYRYYDETNREMTMSAMDPQSMPRIEYYEAPMNASIMPGNQEMARVPPPLEIARQAHHYLYGHFYPQPQGYDPPSQPTEVAARNIIDLGDCHPNFYPGGFSSSGEGAVPFTLQQGFRPSNDISPSGYSQLIQSMSLPVDGFRTQVNRPQELPPVYPQEPIHYQESPFSFATTAPPPNYESLQENNGYLAHHDASVSLPSSSGGLDALLNSPRPPCTSGQPRTTGVFAKDDVVPTVPDVRGTAGGESTPCPHQGSVLVEVPPSASRAPSQALRHGSSPPLRPVGPLVSSDAWSPSTAVGHSPRTARVVAERGRREDLRGRFTKLKDMLPMAGRKGSKVNILDRAILYIEELNDLSRAQKNRLEELEANLKRREEKEAYGVQPLTKGLADAVIWSIPEGSGNTRRVGEPFG